MRDLSILLVNPGFKQIYKFSKNGSSILPSLGLLSIASVLREIKGVSVEYFDCEIEDEDLLEKKLIESKYDIVGISGVTPYFPGMLIIASKAKLIEPETFVLCGGAHATACYKDILRYNVFDGVAVGEAEKSFRDFVIALRNGKKIKDIKGKIEGIIFNDMPKQDIYPAFILDLNTLPIPAYDLANWENYSASFHRNNNNLFATIVTSRGCPYKCRYCKTPLEPPYRYKDAYNVIEEVEYLVDKIGIKGLQFWDDNFTLNKKRAISICKLMEKYRLRWSINTRPDLVDMEILGHLKDAGCSSIFYGIESSNNRILKKIWRDIPLFTIKRAFNLTKRVGIKTVSGCIIGLPYDNEKQILKNIDFIKNLEPNYVHFSIYSPNPETFLFSEIKSLNMLPKDMDWTIATDYQGPPIGMPTCNPYLSREELQSLLRYAYSKFSISDSKNKKYDKAILKQ